MSSVQHVAKTLLLVTSVTILLVTPAAGDQAIIYVDDDCLAPPGTGTQEDPFCTIQSAIMAATNGDTVLVADGTYTGDGNRDLDFQGKLITVQSENGPASCMIDCEGAPNDPHRAFWIHSGEGASALIQGFTIINGDVNGNGGGILCDAASPTIRNCHLENNRAIALAVPEIGTGFGGGIALINSESLVEDCVLNSNFALAAMAFSGFGGGMGMYNSNARVVGSLFESNQALGAVADTGNGGGLGMLDSDARIEFCSFVNNTADSGGGGRSGMGGGVQVRGNAGGATVIEDCTFFGNFADRQLFGGFGGGLAAFADSALPTQVHRSIFVENRSDWFGAGAYIGTEDAGTFEDCDFIHNVSNHNGGGIMGWRADVTVDRCRVLGSRADASAGIHIADPNGEVVTIIKDSIVAGNAADGGNGGGIGFAGGNHQLINTTVRGNWFGGVSNVFYFPTTLDVNSSILWGNEPTQILSDPAAITTVAYSCVEDGYPGVGNIDLPPLFLVKPTGTWTANGIYNASTFQTTFVDDNATFKPNELVGLMLWPDIDASPFEPAEHLYTLIVSNTATSITVWGDFDSMGLMGDTYSVIEYRLQWASPTINKGDPGILLPDAGRDLDHYPRVLCGRVDMGACEYGIGDYDCDGDVDLDDFFARVECTTGPFGGPYDPDCESFDFEFDGDIDFEDYGGMQIIFPVP